MNQPPHQPESQPPEVSSYVPHRYRPVPAFRLEYDQVDHPLAHPRLGIKAGFFLGIGSGLAYITIAVVGRVIFEAMK